jgi:two-component system chemotaxis sensor kinase CheA
MSAAGGPPDEVLREFLSEGLEVAEKLDRDLVALEHDPRDRELLSAVFRGVHTIKGNSGFLGFSGLQALTHAGEALLSRLRDGALELTQERTTALLAMVDAVRRIL